MTDPVVCPAGEPDRVVRCNVEVQAPAPDRWNVGRVTGRRPVLSPSWEDGESGHVEGRDPVADGDSVVCYYTRALMAADPELVSD